MALILESLKSFQNRESTKKNYQNIWRLFNKFLMNLDHRPKFWEDRVSLYCAYLVSRGIQSSTLRSYVSAIKHILKTDGYPWRDERILLSSIVRACKISNDVYKTRLPIQLPLLEVLLFELERELAQQPFLLCLYQALFVLVYYGLMRVGEVANSNHTVKAKDIHVGCNKNKILIVLYSSKTHDKESAPQKIKITEDFSLCKESLTGVSKRNFCPFKLIRLYITKRGNYLHDRENFFIFSDGSPVQPAMVQKVLRRLLNNLNIDQSLYDCHSFRIGRSCDLFKFGVPIEKIKKMGRWRSNAVYKYLRD